MMFFHWTISPVQDFIAQSRHARDLLVSSFLLSYLSGVAMKTVLEQGGKILYPSVYDRRTGEIADELLLKLLGKPSKQEPWMGTLPNRFKAQVDENFQPEACVQAVEQAWQKIADRVWKYLQHQVETSSLTGKEAWKRSEVWQIWDRQTKGFWEQQWGVSDSDDILLRRKFWRNYLPPVEEGAKCTLMSDWQEISGYPDYSKEQKLFWRVLDESVPPHELGDKERLCSIALIKRFFPYEAEAAIGWKFPKQAVHLPSVSTVTIIPWLKKAAQKGKKLKDSIKDYMGSLAPLYLKKVDYYQYFSDHFSSIPTEIKPLVRLDGAYFLEHALERELDARVEKNKLQPSLKDSIMEKYKKLCQDVGAKPAPYFAFIMMDGDRLGQWMRKEKDNYRISQALDDFTGKLLNQTHEFSAIPIYCGGDDVLLMLPMEQALACATRLHTWYEESFRRYIKEQKVTSSIAVVYAHTEAPLQNVLEYVRYLLDDITKERTGRNSLAIGVWKRSGAELEWSAPWDKADHGRSVIDELLMLQQEDVKWKNRNVPLTSILTNQFLTRFHQFDQLPLYQHDSVARKKLMEDIIVEEWFRMRKVKSEERDNYKNIYHELARAVLTLCYASWRDEEENLHFASGSYSPVGAQLLKFMREQGGQP